MHFVCHGNNCVRNNCFVKQLEDVILALCHSMTEEEVFLTSPMLNNINFFTFKKFKKLSVSRMPIIISLGRA